MCSRFPPQAEPMLSDRQTIMAFLQVQSRCVNEVRRLRTKQAGPCPLQPAPMLMHTLPHAHACKCVLHVSRHAIGKSHALLKMLHCLGFQCVCPLKQGVFRAWMQHLVCHMFHHTCCCLLAAKSCLLQFPSYACCLSACIFTADNKGPQGCPRDPVDI